jgi:hypothetical protein
MFGDGIGDRGEIKDLMPILGVRLKKDLATTGAAGIRKVALDLIHVRFRNDATGIPHVAGLGAALLIGGFTPKLSLSFAGQPILAGGSG